MQTIMKKYGNVAVILTMLFCIGGSSEGHAQNEAVQYLIHGKKFFWDAKFKQSIESLKKVTDSADIKKEYCFEAFVYTGFVLLRQNAPKTEVEAMFLEAIRVDPERLLDEKIIPPDLTEPFYAMRDKNVGSLRIFTEPPDAKISAVKGDSLLYEKNSPLKICDMIDRDYDLLITRAGYKEELLPLVLVAGQADTLALIMQALDGKGGKTALKKWGVPGALVLGAGAVFLAVKSSMGDANDGQALPEPPGRLK